MAISQGTQRGLLQRATVAPQAHYIFGCKLIIIHKNRQVDLVIPISREAFLATLSSRERFGQNVVQ